MEEDTIDKIAIQRGLRKMKVSSCPTWMDKNNQEGIELRGRVVRSFWIIDSARDYEEPASESVKKTVELLKEGGAVVHEAKGDKEDNKKESKEQSKEVSPGELQKIDHKERNTLQIGSFTALAKQYNFPEELANLFFMKFDGSLYIKNPGLLFLASRKGYGHIEVSDKYDEKKQEWEAECNIYPALSREVIEAISKLAPEIQLKALEIATQPTNGIGRAGDKTIKMSTMKAFARELAQTRAQNRALRAYTGFGGSSVEERDDVTEKEL